MLEGEKVARQLAMADEDGADALMVGLLGATRTRRRSGVRMSQISDSVR